MEEQQDRIMTAYERGAYTVEDFSRRMATLRKKQAELLERQADAATEVERQGDIIANPEEVIAFAADTAGLMANSPAKERKQLLRRFVKCVWIEAGRGRIQYGIPLPAEGGQRGLRERELTLDRDGDGDLVPPTARYSPSFPRKRESRTLRTLQSQARRGLSESGFTGLKDEPD